MHNINYWTYPEKTLGGTITNEVVKFVNSHGDRYGTDSVKFIDHTIFEDEEKAREYINTLSNGWYEGYAVKFYDYSKCKSTKKVDELKAKFNEIADKRREYITTHHVKDFKASYIGCSKCGSKISREYLRSDKCPVCGHDLRAESTLLRIASFDNRIHEYEARIKEETHKQKAKAEIKWLVKFEYHS